MACQIIAVFRKSVLSTENIGKMCFQKVLFVIIFSELDYNSKKYFFKLLIETLEYSGLYLCVCMNIYIQS